MTCSSKDGWQDWHGHTRLGFGLHYRPSFEHVLPSWLGFISWSFSQRLEIHSPSVTQPSTWRIQVKSDLRTGCLAAVAYTDSDSGANTINLIQSPPTPSLSITWEKRGTSLIFFFSALMFKLLMLAFSTVLNLDIFFCLCVCRGWHSEDMGHSQLQEASQCCHGVVLILPNVSLNIPRRCLHHDILACW